MNLSGSGQAKHSNDLTHCSSPHNGVVNQNDSFSIYHTFKNVQLPVYSSLAFGSTWLNKTSADITVLMKYQSKRNAGFESESFCSYQSGIRNACNKICFCRRWTGKGLSCPEPGIMYFDPINHRITSRKINIFKYTVRLIHSAEIFPAADAVFWDYNNLAWPDITNDFSADRLNGCTFRGKYVCIILFSQNQGFDSVRVSEPNEFSGAHNDAGKSSFQLSNHPQHCLFYGWAVNPFADDLISQYLGIGRCIMCLTTKHLRFFDFLRVHDIPVMNQCKTSLYIVHGDWLCIFRCTASRSWITYMPDTDISLQFFYFFRTEHFTDKAHSFLGHQIASGSGCVGYGNPCRFLTPMLQRNKAVIDIIWYLSAGRWVNAKHSALFMNMIRLWFCHDSFPHSFPLTIKKNRHGLHQAPLSVCGNNTQNRQIRQERHFWFITLKRSLEANSSEITDAWFDYFDEGLESYKMSLDLSKDV